MTDTTERPLVTFAVIAYNQERFIREAIEGAFAQTYEPLEIILSDDCSPDRTFEIMQEMAAAYDGPHRVRLNRNEPNFGLVPHVNQIFDLAYGDLICVNAGDDFSRCDRVETLYTNWIKHGGKHDAIHSEAWEINDLSKSINILSPSFDESRYHSKTEYFLRGRQYGIGATFMYTKRLSKIFGNLPPFAEVEDRPMIFRASLCGGILFVDEPLVYHRQGGVSDFKPEHKGQLILFGGRIKALSWRVSSAKCYLADLNKVTNEAFAIDKSRLSQFIKDGEREIKLSRASSFERLKLLPQIMKETIRDRRLKPVRTYVKYLLWPFSSWIINQKHRLEHDKLKPSKEVMEK